MKKEMKVSKMKAVSYRLVKRVQRHYQLYLLLLPALVYFIIFRYGPMYGVQIAFKDYIATEGFWGSPFVGLKHFTRFFSSPDFPIILKNTLLISVGSLLVNFPVPVIVALMLNQVGRTKFKKFVQNVLYAPHFISVVVLVGMLTIFLDPSSGIINKIIELFGGEPIFFMSEPSLFKPIYILSGTWQSTGWGTIIYLAALSNVSPELYESAEVDGAGKWKKMWHIDFPSILPTAIIQLILNTGNILSVGYEKIFLMQNSLNRLASEVISTYEYKQGVLNIQYSYSAAIGLFNAVINLVILVAVNQIAKKTSETSLW